MIIAPRKCVAAVLWIGALAPQAAMSADPAEQIDQLLNKANDELYVKGHPKESEEAAKQALDLAQRLPDKSRTMRAIIAVGSAYSYQYRWAEGLALFQQAAQQARELGDGKALSKSLNNAGTAMRALGRSEEALSNYHQTVAIARELGDLQGQWTALRNIGALYYETGETDKAKAPLEESLRIARETNYKPGQAISLMTLGLCEKDGQNYSAALHYYEQSLATKPESPLIRVELLNNMGITYEALGKSQKAVELLQQALETQEAAGSGTNPIVLSNLGDSRQSLGQLNEALAAHQRALALTRQGGGNPRFEWQYERNIGKVERAIGHNEEALTYYWRALRGFERIRPEAVLTESGRASFLAKSRAVYLETADLLVDLHREAEALEVAERGRARAFLDMLAQSRTGIAEELTPEQVKREEAILARISAAQKELWRETIRPERQSQADLTSAEADLEAFHLEMRQANPHYASIRYPEPITVAAIQNELLDARTVLVEFLLGEKRSLVWVVSKKELTTAVLPPRREIEEQVAAYRKRLSERVGALTLHRSLAEVNRLGQGLYRALLQPVQSALASSRTLVIVPDGVLHYLPFETLLSESRPGHLIEKFTTVYGPSASALATIRTMNRQAITPLKILLAFGDPLVPASPEWDATRASNVPDEYAERGFSLVRLPYTRDEVLGIGKLYTAAQRRIYLGDHAREEAVKRERLDQFRYIHFASHGFIDETKPGRSGILLSRDARSAEDGVLQMGEIMRLKLNADLVTLSACSTGLGKLVNGEGILGLTRAFFYSGARNVVVSLWDVNDSATSALMQAFYENLNRGLSKSAALRQAKLTLLYGKDARWHHPYFWSAFILLGEGK